MTLMKRRRALMMAQSAAPSADVLWSLSNHPVSAGDSIDTEIAPFVAGLSTTILLDYDQQDYTTTSNAPGSRVMYLFTTATGSSKLAVGKNGRTTSKMYHLWMSGSATEIPNVDCQIGRKRIAVTHSADSGDITIYAKTGDTLETVTVSGTFAASNLPLLIGGDATNYTLLAGTITEARIYNRILSAEEINAFFA